MSKMLIGETQEDLASAINEFFSLDGYTVQLESSGWRMLECLRHNQYDVIILEMALPGLDGMSIVRDYRATGGSTPILLISDKHSSDDLRCGLDTGADAYLCKPFRLTDLAAQVKALMRRPLLRSGRILRLSDLVLDAEAGSVTRNDVPIHLHPMEFKLLHFFMSHPNQVFDAHALLQRVWQKEFGQMEDTVRTHIRTLRQKIDVAGHDSIITTIRGLGYKVSDHQDLHCSKALTVSDLPVPSVYAESRIHNKHGGDA